MVCIVVKEINRIQSKWKSLWLTMMSCLGHRHTCTLCPKKMRLACYILMTLAVKRIHNLSPQLRYVSTLPDITQKRKSYVVFLSVVWVALKRTVFGVSKSPYRWPWCPVWVTSTYKSLSLSLLIPRRKSEALRDSDLLCLFVRSFVCLSPELSNLELRSPFTTNRKSYMTSSKNPFLVP